jgi:hypothetical protein
MLKIPPPWTDDPILDKFRFTNSYRELDRGTLYAKQVVLLADNLEQCFMQVLCYRLFNRVETYDKVFRKHYMSGALDWKEIHTELIELHEKKPIFTRAHVLPTFGARKANGETKLEKVIEMLQDVESHLTPIIHDVFDNTTFEEAHRALQKVDNLGDFLAYEVLTDLAYTNLVSFNEDDWANAGPGARDGLRLLYPESTKTRIEYMRELQANQNFMFHSLGLPLWHVAGPKVHSSRLTLRNIEGGLCEYFKYNQCVEGHFSNRLPYSLGEAYVWQQ